MQQLIIDLTENPDGSCTGKVQFPMEANVLYTIDVLRKQITVLEALTVTHVKENISYTDDDEQVEAITKLTIGDVFDSAAATAIYQKG